MEIVIKISDEDYKRIQDTLDVFNSLTSRAYSAIRNGTPLPEHHGRLGDLDRVKAMVFNASMDEHFMPIKLLTCDDVTDIIDYTPTIIEGA